MTSSALTFDRLAYVDRLRNGGIEEGQVRAHAEALDAALKDSVATRNDLDEVGRDLRREIREVETRLEAKIETSAANLRVEILRWLIVTQSALAGFVFAAIKFVR
ncbi:hypothetical protein V3H18_05795 [Methylocystis sp. 9N]|uniref:DUF1640 domain-containing protein n=1 Tax=Methylocystis borbori TaxID=3118750 RepID=A0ABU7XF83_9HYPH